MEVDCQKPLTAGRRVVLLGHSLKNGQGDLRRSLLIDGKPWMSNEDFECGIAERVAETAKGRCFVAGFGIGLILHYLQASPAVTEIDVVEIEPEVVELIVPTVKLKLTPPVRVRRGDANFDFDGTYDWMEFDHWLTEKDFREQSPATLERARKHLKPGGFIEVWMDRKREFDRSKETA